MAFNAETVLRRSDSASYEIVAGEAILIDVNSGTYFSLNMVGTDFWELIDGTQTIEQQATTVAEKYDVDVPMVLADLIELAEKMAADGLVNAV